MIPVKLRILFGVMPAWSELGRIGLNLSDLLLDFRVRSVRLDAIFFAIYDSEAVARMIEL